MAQEFLHGAVYQIMTEQPDCCHGCGSRLVLLDIANIDDERVFLCECPECQRIVPVVEDCMEEIGD
jgi:hypothetical protein